MNHGLVLMLFSYAGGGGNPGASGETCEDALNLVLNLSLPLQGPLPEVLKVYSNLTAFGTQGELVKVLCDNPGSLHCLLQESTPTKV